MTNQLVTTPRVDPFSGHPLDQATWASLGGHHAQFAEERPKARRFRGEVAPFAALPPVIDDEAWADLLDLAGPGRLVHIAGSVDAFDAVPLGWEIVAMREVHQLVATDRLQSRPDPEAVLLGAADADAMIGLARGTAAGPFRREGYRLGSFLGIRRGGELIAMAGEGLRPPGWTDITTVCTHPDHRRQGLATRLVRAVAHGIRARGETPFLHMSSSNTGGLRHIEAIGFQLRLTTTFGIIRTPVAPDTR